MGDGAAPVLDVSALRLRLSMVGAGVWLTFLVCLAGFGYVAWTWDQPDRALLGAVFAAGMVGGFLVWALPTEPIIRSRWREPFFLAWSLLDLALIASLVVIDGSIESPLALIFFVPVVFAAMSYPLPSVIAVGVSSVAVYLGIAATDSGASSPKVVFFACALAGTGVMSAWQARNHDRQRCELSRVSRADPLTKCLNRRGLRERADAELAHSLRHGMPFSVLVLDLDNFKQVNDTRGHSTGDAVLCRVVESLGQVVRPSDAVGRLGGDEFAVLLPETGETAASAIAERITEALDGDAPCSIGVACFPLDGNDLDALLREADTRLYASRNRRGGRPVAHGERLSWATAMAEAVDMRMDTSHEHSRAVASYAVTIAAEMGWDPERQGLLRLAGMLHDVGKVAVPDEILRKPGSLTDEEYAEVKHHPVIGADLVARVEGLDTIAPWIRHSHEHFDGTGYPSGLSGEDIPLAARILLVADAFDAMISDRPYRESLSHEEALRELEHNAGGQFDPRCVELLVDHVRAGAVPSR
ncbi:MAG TPA: diguanylate cyclase [Solirubrobacteraceae bacterium]|jgi:diguanylate cyclase (GGDEF)-like protein|nr:diguanylate cyclase [Solirubrobacteraceae bacterium]